MSDRTRRLLGCRGAEHCRVEPGEQGAGLRTPESCSVRDHRTCRTPEVDTVSGEVRVPAGTKARGDGQSWDGPCACVLEPAFPRVRHSPEWGTKPFQMLEPAFPRVRHDPEWGTKPFQVGVGGCLREGPD